MATPHELPWTGERLVPSERGDIVLEHLHRYAFALELAAGRDVLDIACGEGYGSHLLAGRARNVIGVDISEEVVRHAASTYPRPNLTFRAGNCTAIPLPDRSVDLVVCFETIEHFAEHEQFLAEVRRVLRAGGLLVVSTPDKSIYSGKLGARNQFHPRELEAAEFQKLLGGHFAHTRLLNQRVALGSFVGPIDDSGPVEVGTHRGDFQGIDFTPGVAEGIFLIGVGSDAPLPPLKTGLFEFGQLQGETFIAPLRPGNSELQARDRRIAELDTALASALQWQRRSWFWRAFHRWRPPWEKQERIGILTKLERSFRKRRERWLGENKNGAAAPSSQTGAAAAPNQAQRETVRTVALSTERPAAWAGASTAGGRRVLFVSGEPDTPGHVYRVDMMAAALGGRGHETRILRADQLSAHLPLAAGANVIVFWRVPWDEATATATETARRAGAKIVFDMDDLMLDPALARSVVIDGIRAQGHDEAAMARYFHRLQQTMAAADFCTGTTRPLAAAFRQLDKIAFVLPNGFDEARYRSSRKAAAGWRASRDGLVRIGYAGGTRTHQRDFRQTTAALARILKEQANCRLVLFREETAAGTLPYIDLDEFPELAEVASQVEWRRIVPFHEVPAELARFDINLAPLETGNVFCEAKSELKYFEAALVDVPTVASPTVPYAEAIRDGETGFLAGNDSQWYETLRTLVTDADLRRRVGRAAALDVLWRFGPERRAELAGVILEQIIDHHTPAAMRAGELEFRRAAAPRPGLPECAEADVIFEAGSPGQGEVAVVISLHNYAGYVTEALESVKQQTLAQKELIVVEDGSTDDSLRVAHEWLQQNAAAFTRVALLKNRRNARLSRTRNAGFAFTDAPFVFPLDADNLLLPGCLEACWQAIRRTDAAFAYPTVQEFGTRDSQRSNGPWNPWRLVRGNYIDAMALIRRSAWAAVGGYQAMDDLGWEDYEFWCHFAEMGFRGIWVPEPLAKYRAHPQSMLHTVTDVSNNRRRVSEVMRRLHPWVDV